MNQYVIVIAIYLIMMLAAGLLFKRGKSLIDFHLAGRNLKTILLTGTFCATIVGASSTIGMAGLGFSSGLPGAWWMLSGTIGLFILSIFFAEKVRGIGVMTLPQLLGSFYGERVKTASAILISVSWIGVIAVQIAAAGKILSLLFGGDGTAFMIACSLVFILYTAHGGQGSVVRTDLMQFMIIIAGMALLFWRALESAGVQPLLSQSFPTSEQMDCYAVLSMIMIVGSAYLVGPDMHSRLLSAKSPKDARTSTLFASLILIPLAFMITGLGVLARSVYPSARPEDAIPALLTGLLDPISGGIVASALLAAFMSSADTSLMTVSSILTFDIYERLWPGSDQKRLLRLSRMAVLLAGMASLLLAAWLPGIIKTLLIAYTIFTGGVFMPTVLGFYKERLGLTGWGAMSALLGGGITAAIFGQSHPMLGMAASLILLISVSHLQRRFAIQRRIASPNTGRVNANLSAEPRKDRLE